MVLSTEQRILYDNLYCAYKIKRESKIECRHPYSFRIHDLELCPIVQDYFANIIFQEDGIYLIIKKPSKDSVSGTWDKIFLDIKLDKILLTEEQVEFYDLPSAPGEENKVELDALEVYYPGEIKKIVEEAVSIYIDLEVMEEVNKINDIIRQKLYSIIVDALEPIRDQLESIQLPPNLVGELPKAEIIEEESDALYDSSRDYVDQTLFFKQFLRSRS